METPGLAIASDLVPVSAWLPTMTSKALPCSLPAGVPGEGQEPKAAVGAGGCRGAAGRGFLHLCFLSQSETVVACSDLT